MYISVIIPACNEEESLPFVINALPRYRINDVIIVDNGSTDKTAEVAAAAGCRVVYEGVKGYGRACLAGIAALNSRTEVVVFIDGDFSDHPDQLLRLIEPIIRSGYDLVIGSRMLGRREEGAMPPAAYYGNKLACFLIRKFWNVRYTDLGPFRAIRLPALQRLKMQDENFGWTIEMQIKAVEQSLKVKEVPVDYRRRIGRSKISGTITGTILAGGKILWTIFRYKFLK